MSSTYSGNSANNPASITIPSDGDAPIQASDVNPAFEGIMDLIRRTGAVDLPGALRVEEFTSTGTFNVPTGVTKVLVIGCGGGGGGGQGSGNGVSTDEWWCAGGGGGGATLGFAACTVTSGGTVAVTIGAGGASATNGGDTTFGSLATFSGAKAGISSLNANTRRVTTSTSRMCAEGGLSNRSQLAYMNLSISATNIGFSIWDSSAIPAGITALHFGTQQVGQGGRGGVATLLTTAEPGAPNAFGGYAGGSRGSIGTDSGSYRGGGAGGGGAAGPFGAGANGGNGSNANNAGATSAGGTGSSAAANTGAGGSGGGSAGCANPGAGGFANYDSAGGSGGSGRLFVIYTDGP